MVLIDEDIAVDPVSKTQADVLQDEGKVSRDTDLRVDLPAAGDHGGAGAILQGFGNGFFHIFRAIGAEALFHGAVLPIFISLIAPMSRPVNRSGTEKF